ncbi:DUF4011 domain-containing protein [Phytoactinopolyspora limicola]|uniref:DUF4011 domain-containing protein n=1 Tax=Phytoactinopolyspora limicola TaxID=2715536 RepID=UPI00140A4EA8|nr:DUF4011 domain-containing protein [Phytoactinopolyspora limicola]
MSASQSEGVVEVVQRWKDELAALGGRDPLLSFRDLKVGTLDLAAADPEARRLLMEGDQVALSKLFPHEPLRSSALRSIRAIRDKARELAEERGIGACLLAIGVATWSNPFVAHRPTAPVLLRQATVVARDPAETDFVISVADESIVNPVLLHALDAQLGLRFQADDLRDHSGHLKYPTVVERLREFAPAHVVDGFSIAHRAVLATFATAPLLLSRDIEDLSAELGQHDVVAALAGDEKAGARLGATLTTDQPRYLAFDTDIHQREVISAVAGGGHLLVDAPPGSGRTQVVAGMVAELVGRGQKVLIVGQKRAALGDIATRLAAAGLDDVLLDAGVTSSTEAVRHVTETARELREALDQDAIEPGHPPPGAPDAGQLAAELDAYRDAMHRNRQPGGISAYQALVRTATAPQRARTSVRIPTGAIQGETGLADVTSALLEYAQLEGLTLTEDGSPWYGSDIPSADTADSLGMTVVGLRDTHLGQLRDLATRAAVEVGLTGPNSVEECADVVDLLLSVERTLKIFGPGIWSEPLADLAAATGTRTGTSEGAGRPGFLARRRLRRRAAELSGRYGRQHRESVHAALVEASDQLTRWKKWSRDGRPPRTGEYLPRAAEAVTTVRRRLGVLAAANPRTQGLEGLPFVEVGRRLAALAADERHLRAMPRLLKLEAKLSAAGLDELLADLRRRKTRPDGVEQVLEYAWLASLLDEWKATDAALSRFDDAAHRRAIEEFRGADVADVLAAATRVRSARAERFAAVCEDYEGQAEVLAGAVGGALDAASAPKTLLETAPDVALAAVPCWMMSPLDVARILPPRPLFDVVIIEDAARLTVAQAVPAIARGSRVVVIADDDVALPAFTTAFEPAPDPDELEGPWAGDPPASVAEVLRPVLPTRHLHGQHRFRDDRLVGFAVQAGYANRLVTVPGAGGNERVLLDLVDAPAGGDDPVDSSSAEVKRVVELVLQHLRNRPHESLGIVTLGPRHAERLDAALRRSLVRAPDVAPLLREDRAEPFFVKDVERAAGDVRDAIILSLGYGRSVDGRILYRFGALGRPGGERRLVSASTRARERLTVVSTFGADDLSPRRLTTPGAQALGEFLTYVESGARVVPDGPAPSADALAEAIAHRLRQAGAVVEVGYGGPGGVAVAARHPTRQDRYVLAVETDSPGGAAARPARERERIRPAQLERLGWSVHRVWAAAWSADPENEGKRLVRAYEDAVAAADAYDWAVAAAEADVVAGMPEEAELEPTAAVVPPNTGEATHEADVNSGAAGDGELVAGSASGGSDVVGGEVVGGEVDGGEVDGEPADGLSDAAGLTATGPRRVGARPSIGAGRELSDYTCRELSGLARWVESDGLNRREDHVVDLVAVELGLSMDDPRTRDVLRHAVRVSRAGYPPAPSTA